jgi:hypothetical protein
MSKKGMWACVLLQKTRFVDIMPRFFAVELRERSIARGPRPMMREV